MTVEWTWNPPQSRFLTIASEANGAAEYIDLEGAVRAGKSTPAVHKLARYAVRYPGIHLAAARWTQDGLDAQVKPLWRDAAAQRGLSLQWHPDEEYDEIQPYGSRVYLRALKASEETARYGKLAGLTLAVLWIDQPEEVPRDVVQAYLPARLSQVGFPHEAWLTPNPVGDDHWLSEWFPTDADRPHHHYIHTSIYDNRHVLGDAYIADMEAKYPVGSALRRRFVDGLRGLGVVGDPVYAGYFHSVLRRGAETFPWHVVTGLAYDDRYPIYEGWDFGYTHPAVLWTQFVHGQWRVLGECMGANQYIDDFADYALSLRAQLFPCVKRRFFSVCDPAGFAKSSHGLRQTAAEILTSKKVDLEPFDAVKDYNVPSVEYGAIQATAQLMRKTLGVEPAFVVDSRCQTFITGLEAGYIWSNKSYAGSMGSLRQPDKQRDTTYNHLQDCWLYTFLRWGQAGMTEDQVRRLEAQQQREAARLAQLDTDPYDLLRRNAQRRAGMGRGGY